MKNKLKALLAAAFLIFGIGAVGLSPTPTHATYGAFTNVYDCYASHTGNTPRVCLDPTVGSYGPTLYVYANGGDYWTARTNTSAVGGSSFVRSGWVAWGLGTDVNLYGSYASATGLLYSAFYDPYVGPVPITAGNMGGAAINLLQNSGTLLNGAPASKYDVFNAMYALLGSNANIPFFVVN